MLILIAGGGGLRVLAVTGRGFVVVFRFVAAVLVFVVAWFLVRVGGFGGSVPVVVLVLVLAEQLQGLGGLSENADGFGTADVNGVWIALAVEDVGDSVDGGFEPDGVTGGGAGNDQLQPAVH